MSFFRRLRVTGMLVVLSGAPLFGAGIFSQSAPAHDDSSVLVDLSGANLTGGGTTAGSAAPAAPIVEVANKKKKPAPSMWSRILHPTQWFSSSKSKK
jgi:hypothetical protein